MYILVQVKRKDKKVMEKEELNVFLPWIDNIAKVKNKVIRLYPNIEWETRHLEYPNESYDVFGGQALDIDGRLELTISQYPFDKLLIESSINVGQITRIIEIARLFSLSILDVQTGEWVE